eukprot:scaffold40248_cov72-Phaeocystis_antarctica.AAC.2
MITVLNKGNYSPHYTTSVSVEFAIKPIRVVGLLLSIRIRIVRGLHGQALGAPQSRRARRGGAGVVGARCLRDVVLLQLLLKAHLGPGVELIVDRVVGHVRLVVLGRQPGGRVGRPQVDELPLCDVARARHCVVEEADREGPLALKANEAELPGARDRLGRGHVGQVAIQAAVPQDRVSLAAHKRTEHASSNDVGIHHVPPPAEARTVEIGLSLDHLHVALHVLVHRHEALLGRAEHGDHTPKCGLVGVRGQDRVRATIAVGVCRPPYVLAVAILAVAILAVAVFGRGPAVAIEVMWPISSPGLLLGHTGRMGTGRGPVAAGLGKLLLGKVVVGLGIGDLGGGLVGQPPILLRRLLGQRLPLCLLLRLLRRLLVRHVLPLFLRLSVRLLLLLAQLVHHRLPRLLLLRPLLRRLIAIGRGPAVAVWLSHTGWLGHTVVAHKRVSGAIHTTATCKPHLVVCLWQPPVAACRVAVEDRHAADSAVRAAGRDRAVDGTHAD